MGGVFFFLSAFIGELKAQSTHWDLLHIHANDNDRGVGVFRMDTSYMTISYVDHYTQDSVRAITTARIDSAGNRYGRKEFFGKDRNIYLREAIRAPDSGIVAVGRSKDVSTSPPGPAQGFVVRFAPNGDTLWSNAFPGDFDREGATSIDTVPGGGFLVSGAAYTSSNEIRILIWKLDKQGKVQWKRIFGASSGQLGAFFDVIALGNESFIISGLSTKEFSYPNSDDARPFVVRMDSSGSTQWLQNFGPVDLRSGSPRILRVDDDSIAFAVTIADPTLNDTSDNYMLRYLKTGVMDTSGYIGPSFEHDSIRWDWRLKALKKGGNGDLDLVLRAPYEVSNFLILDPDQGEKLFRTYEGESNSLNTTFVLSDIGQALDTGHIFFGRAGGYKWALKTNCADFDTLPEASFDKTVSGYQAYFKDQSEHYVDLTWYFDDGDSLSNVEKPMHSYSSEGNYQVKLVAEACGVKDTTIRSVKITDTSTSLARNEGAPFSIALRPNPAHDQVFIEHRGIPDGARFKLRDPRGKVLRELEARKGSRRCRIDVSDLGRGVYFFEVHWKKGKRIESRKLVIR